MYDTFIMLKPGVTFTLDEMEALVRDACADSQSEVVRQRDGIIIEQGDNFIEIGINKGRAVLEESMEIADATGADCEECKVRFEMTGEDDERVLYNDYLLINERLDAMGQFVIFDPQEGVLFGE